MQSVLGGALIGNELDKNDREEARRRKRSAAQRTIRIRDGTITRQDVMNWVRQGDRDDLIIDRIERSGTVFQISSRDENALRDAGVSEEVIRTMKDTARR